MASSAPNRSARVIAILNGLPPALETPDDDARRANLYELVRRLNVDDAGMWGVLIKTDQNGKVPADIIVWRPTREHFDVMTGSDAKDPKPAKPSWGAHGVVTNPAWLWVEVPGSAPPVVDPDDTGPKDPDQSGDNLKEKVDRILAALEEINTRPAPVYVGTIDLGWLGGVKAVRLEPQKK